MDFSEFKIISSGFYSSNTVQRTASASRKRTVSCFEIEFPIQHGGTLHINHDSCSVTPNSIFIAKPGQTRYTEFPLVCYYIHFNIFDEELFNILISCSNSIRIYDNSFYTDIIKKISFHQSINKIESKIRLKGLVYDLIYNLLKDNHISNNKSIGFAQYHTIIKATEYIKEHLQESLSLESLAAVFGFSPTYFHKLFHKATGTTLHNYIEEQRIAKAINLMLTTNYTLTRIAYECGFSSQSYFSYACKRHKSMTPRRYVAVLSDKYERNS